MYYMVRLDAYQSNSSQIPAQRKPTGSVSDLELRSDYLNNGASVSYDAPVGARAPEISVRS
jgi:hypothetical protein